MIDTILAKTLSLVGILLFSIIFGIAPIFLEKYVRSPKIHWINNAVICFTGGTLLGITFLHLVPETRESVNVLLNKGYFSEFPQHISLADVVIWGGFFFIYIIDELIHLLLECVGADHSHQPHGRRGSLLEGDGCSTKGDASKNTKDEGTSTERDEIPMEAMSHEIPWVISNSINVPSILTILALSFHDVFEGLALGIQKHYMDVIFMFLSVATHKFAISFSVSLDLLLSGITAKMILLYTICFSMVNPFGIALGISMTLFRPEGDIETPLTVVMQGIASGSLIYVVCFEVLQRHGSSDGGHVVGIRNTIFVIVGYTFILAMKIMTDNKPSDQETLNKGGAIQRTPSPCPNGLSFCESTDDYPKDFINEILKKQPKLILDLLKTEDDYDDAVHKVDSDDFFDDPLCVALKRTVYPTKAQSDKGMFFVVNHDNYRQGLRVESCVSVGGQCQIPGSLSIGYTSRCVQRYIEHTLVVLNKNSSDVKGLITKTFEFPSCCSCVVSMTHKQVWKLSG